MILLRLIMKLLSKLTVTLCLLIFSFQSIADSSIKNVNKYRDKFLATGMGSTFSIDKNNLIIVVNKTKALNAGVIVLNGSLATGISKSDIDTKPISTATFVGFISAGFVLRHIYKNTDLNQLHVNVFLLESAYDCLSLSELCDSDGNPRQFPVFSFDTDRSLRIIKFEYSEWYEKQNNMERGIALAKINLISHDLQ